MSVSRDIRRYKFDPLSLWLNKKVVVGQHLFIETGSVVFSTELL